MKRMRRILAAGVAIALCAVAVTGCQSTASDTSGGPGSEQPAAEPYRVGVVLSLTGTYAALGTSEKQALELEIERINASGGVNGREIALFIEDDATDEAKAVAATSKLIDQENVIAIIGATGTGQSMAMRSELQRAGVPQLSMAGGTVVTAEFDPLVFQTPWSNTLVVPFVLDAIKQDGHTKVALLSDTGGYGKDGRDVILGAAEQAGIEIVEDSTFNPGDNDMTVQLTRIKSSQAEALLLWTAGKEAGTAVKNAASLGLELPLYGGSGQARKEFIEGSGEAGEGFVFGTGKSLVPANWGEGSAEYGVVSDFATRYEERFGTPPDIFAGHAFDAVLLLVDALERAGDEPDPAAVRDALEGVSGVAGFGGIFTFSADDHNGLTADDLALYRIEDGKWVTIR